MNQTRTVSLLCQLYMLVAQTNSKELIDWEVSKTEFGSDLQSNLKSVNTF